MLKNIKTIFFGTPDFAVPTLKNLISHVKVIAVVTQLDKKVGRKQKIIFSPIKILAQRNNIQVLQPVKLKDTNFIQQIKDLNPDVIIVAAYGKIIPQEILDLPKFGCLNIHGSLLPKYRGASPIQTAILNGEKETGITIIKMNAKMDEGDIVAKQIEKIYNNDTSQTLHDRLSQSGTDLLIKILPDYLNKKIKPVPQNPKSATYTKIIQKTDGHINWLQNAKQIDQQIRAFTPWPSAFTIIDNKRFKILKAKPFLETSKFKTGQIFVKNNQLFIACKKSYLQIIKWQQEGKKPIATSDYLRGHKDIINKITR